MDQQRMLLTEKYNGLPKEIDIPEIDEETQSVFKRMVAFAEELQGIKQLFDIFIYNLTHMADVFTMYYNDEIIRNDNKNSASFIEVNAYLVNVIGAGKTLTEAIEVFFSEEIGKEAGIEFKRKCLSKKYDECFSYRFLIFLRNYSQHGHLPVSRNLDGRFCFDLSQIMCSRHIKINGAMKKSMDHVYQEMVEKMKTEPLVAFTYTLDTYSLTVVEVYYSFLREIESVVKQHHDEVNTILKEHPEYVCSEFGEWKDVVVFDEEDGMLHLFFSKDNLWNAYIEYKKYAKEKLKFYQREHTEISDLI